MGKAIKVCRVCGKEYTCCLTPNKEGVFRWFDVTCCREHGQVYLERVMNAGTPDRKEQETESQSTK